MDSNEIVRFSTVRLEEKETNTKCLNQTQCTLFVCDVSTHI